MMQRRNVAEADRIAMTFLQPKRAVAPARSRLTRIGRTPSVQKRSGLGKGLVCGFEGQNRARPERWSHATPVFAWTWLSECGRERHAFRVLQGVCDGRRGAMARSGAVQARRWWLQPRGTACISRLPVGIEFAPRGGTGPTAGASIRCGPGAVTGRHNTDNIQMHRRGRVGSLSACQRSSMHRM